jgi:hypothetical protein
VAVGDRPQRGLAAGVMARPKRLDPNASAGTLLAGPERRQALARASTAALRWAVCTGRSSMPAASAVWHESGAMRASQQWHARRRLARIGIIARPRHCVLEKMTLLRRLLLVPGSP